MISQLNYKVFFECYMADLNKNISFPKAFSDHSYGYMKAAKDYGLEIKRESKNKINFSKNGSVIGQLRYMLCDFTTPEAVKICSSKAKTIEFLNRGSISTAESAYYDAEKEYEEALAYWYSKKHLYDMVVKPSSGKSGYGITVGINSEQEFYEAWEEAKENIITLDPSIIIEERLEGIDVRVVVVNGKVACATTRMPAYVVGNGKSTIQDLIEIKGLDRALNPYHKPWPLLNAKEYAVDFSYIPANNELFLLSDKANIHQGGEAVDVTRLISKELKRTSIDAALSIPGLGVAGVDLIVKNFIDDSGTVIEINTNCNFGMHYSPMIGESYNPACLIVEDMIASLDDSKDVFFDLSRWKESCFHNSVSEFVDCLNVNGVHQVNMEYNPLHFLIDNLESDNDYILIGFSGAVTERKRKKAPFFSFLNIAREIKIGLISIADSSLSLSKDLSLAWYLGNHINTQLAETLASILDSVVKRTGKKLILSGGSGGGFAALNIHAKMEEKHMAKCFVWNPQTDITHYKESAVFQYFNTCYPSNEMGKANVGSIRKFFVSNNISYKVEKDESLYQLVFINGYDPSHIRKHVSRLYPKKEEDNNFIYFGDWGYGHVQPPSLLIKYVILKISQNTAFRNIVNSIGSPNRELLDFDVHAGELSEKLKVKAVIVRKVINLRCNLIDFFLGFQLRFSILDEGNKVFYQSGYLLGANRGEVFIDGGSCNLERLKGSILRVDIEDYKGDNLSFSYKLEEIKETHSIMAKSMFQNLEKGLLHL
ncbi:ATP-grasp domain-containing protein [Halomonas sp. AOP42-A1-14]|uniref:ATP-grasp domain-containing protein n=1 Tax=Halomonas sp. AOP42-A1-14 TaxID=3457676 RepID=UPI0040338DBB